MKFYDRMKSTRIDADETQQQIADELGIRSEERRVGKECGS